MVVYKIIKMHAVSEAHVPLALYRMCYLKIVVIVVGAVKGLVQGIVGDGMQSPFIDPASVISVDHLAHQPEVVLQAVSYSSQLAHEALLKHICSVKADPVDIELRYPEAHSVEQILSHFRLIQVQFRQQIVAAPVFV